MKYLPRRPRRSISRPCTASTTSPGARGSVQRGSRISRRVIVRPSTWGASCRRIVSTSGSSGIADLEGRLRGGVLPLRRVLPALLLLVVLAAVAAWWLFVRFSAHDERVPGVPRVTLHVQDGVRDGDVAAIRRGFAA